MLTQHESTRTAALNRQFLILHILHAQSVRTPLRSDCSWVSVPSWDTASAPPEKRRWERENSNQPHSCTLSHRHKWRLTLSCSAKPSRISRQEPRAMQEIFAHTPLTSGPCTSSCSSQCRRSHPLPKYLLLTPPQLKGTNQGRATSQPRLKQTKSRGWLCVASASAQVGQLPAPRHPERRPQAVLQLSPHPLPSQLSLCAGHHNCLPS